GSDAPVDHVPPSISGAAQEGSLLRADRGHWHAGAHAGFSYQWRQCGPNGGSCADIPRANDSVYSVRAGDAGHTLRVAVTARNAHGSGTAVSAATPVLAPLPAQAPHDAALPAIGGSTVPGQVLTASPGIWTGAQPMRLAYRWRICGPFGGDCLDSPLTAQSYT